RGRYALYLQIGLYVTLGFLLVFTLAAAFTLAHAAWTGDFLGFLPAGGRGSGEGGLQVPGPAAGGGRRRHLEFPPSPRDSSADPWLVPLLGVALAVLAFLIYRKESRIIGGGAAGTAHHSTRGRWPAVLMAVLRVGLFLLMLSILMPQLRLWF